jgi:carboxymethylenebutenolidase
VTIAADLGKIHTWMEADRGTPKLELETGRRGQVGQTIALEAKDGHKFSAYEATPDGEPRGGLVIVQEIFGVNAHIRKVADGYAAAGYRAIAPAIFDRAERGTELEPTIAEERDKGIALRQKISIDEMLLDIAAAIAVLQKAGKVGIVGYCLGGSLAWLSAARVDGLAAAVGYYGSLVAKHLDETPRCPVMLHFGENDPSIPQLDVKKVQEAVDPSRVQVFTYADAGHAFNRDGGPNWREAAAKLALERTLAFFQQHIG